MKPRAIICDLDGTLAHSNGKRSFYDEMKCYGDSIDSVVSYVLSLLAEDGITILFTSGRKEKSRGETTRWLDDYAPESVVGSWRLFMRKDDDNRKDCIVKEEIYRNEIEPNYRVVLVLDDRDSVCAKWRELGLKCFQVAPGDF
jgi:FMN phosphatase YigB (HAD superfamily)